MERTKFASSPHPHAILRFWNGYAHFGDRIPDDLGANLHALFDRSWPEGLMAATPVSWGGADHIPCLSKQRISGTADVRNLCIAGVGQNCGPILAMVTIVATLPPQ